MREILCNRGESMSENAKRHAELAAEINAVMPEFVTRTVMFHQAVAQAVGRTGG
jgi:hypothetical protein